MLERCVINYSIDNIVEYDILDFDFRIWKIVSLHFAEGGQINKLHTFFDNAVRTV